VGVCTYKICIGRGSGVGGAKLHGFEDKTQVDFHTVNGTECHYNKVHLNAHRYTGYKLYYIHYYIVPNTHRPSPILKAKFLLGGGALIYYNGVKHV